MGIRELAASVGIKESSFYNHYRSKEDLFDAILGHWAEVNERSTVSAEEYLPLARRGDPAALMAWMMERFRQVTDTPVVHAILAIVRMESFTRPDARAAGLRSMYHVRGPCTLAALRAMEAVSGPTPVDLEAWTASYYYGLIGLLDELVLLETAEADTDGIMRRIGAHFELFVGLLRPAGGRRAARKERSGR